MEGSQAVLTICGSRGSRPVSGPGYEEFGGHTTCFVIRWKDQAVVIDCGSGLTCAAPLLRECSRVDVLLSHLHYDHIMGLTEWSVFPAGIEPVFYSTFSCWGEKDPLEEFCRPPFWPVGPGKHQLREVTRGEPVLLGDGMEAVFYRSEHPDEGNILLIKVENTTLAILCDYEHGGQLPREMEGCDLLIYDGMYSDETYPAYRGWGHSTWQEACRCAARMKAKKLLVTHHAPESEDDLLRQWECQARELFPLTNFARQGQTILL